MSFPPSILATRDSDGLYYIIAVLILSAAGAIFNKLKEKMAEPPVKGTPLDEDEELDEDVPRRPPARPTMPLPRPVIRENLPGQRPAPPGRMTPARPEPAREFRPAPRPPVRPPVRPLPRPGTPAPVEGRRIPTTPRPPAPLRTQRPAPARPVRPAQPAEPPTPSLEDGEYSERVDRPPVEALQKVTVTSPPPAPSASPAAALVGLARRLGRDELRRAIVLNEVLSPPLAIRE